MICYRLILVLLMFKITISVYYQYTLKMNELLSELNLELVRYRIQDHSGNTSTYIMHGRSLPTAIELYSTGFFRSAGRVNQTRSICSWKKNDL